MQNAKIDSTAVHSSFLLPLNTQQLKEELQPVVHSSTSTFERRNGLTYLINEHNLLRELMRRYEFEAKTIQQRMEIVPQLTKLICQHLSMEEKFVYPLIRNQIPDGEFLYERLMLDDLQNKESLAVIERFVPTSVNIVEFDKLMLKLIINEIEHLNEEETVLIPRLEARLSEEQLAQLELDLMNYKEQAPTHPHLTLLDMQFGPGQTGSVRIQTIEGKYDKIVDSAQVAPSSQATSTAISTDASTAYSATAAPSSSSSTVTSHPTTQAQQPAKVQQMPPLPAKTVLQHLSISRLTDTEKQAQVLRDNGVQNLLDLLHKGKSRRDVLDLEKKAGIAHERLIKMIHQADLMRIRGITTYVALLMVESGVRSVHDLARRVPSHLVGAMHEVNADMGIVEAVPSEEQVRAWVTQAHELPSMVEL